MCKHCQHTIFAKADFAREATETPPIQRAYANLMQFQQGIQLLLPKFQRLLSTFQDPDKPPNPTQMAEATKVRKRLMDAFTQYDVAARRVRDLPTESQTQERLQKAIYAQATTFLHIHMLPLKSIPKLMRKANPAPSPQAVPDGRLAGSTGPTALKAIHLNQLERPSSSRASSTTTDSTAANALEAEERELRERLIVLEEQKFMVQEMVVSANKRRRFDEVGALAQNMDDLSREIDQIQGQIAGLDFAGAYSANGVGEIGG